MEQLFVFCDFYWSCAHSDWIMSSVDNVTIICDGSCHRSDYQMNNVPYAQILCKGDVTNPSRLYETCDQVVINAEQNTQLDVLCEYDRACDDISVCSDGILNLDCIGNNTCSPLNVGKDRKGASSINCQGDYSCQTVTQDSCSAPTPTPFPTPIAVPTTPTPAPLWWSGNESSRFVVGYSVVIVMFMHIFV